MKLIRSVVFWCHLLTGLTVGAVVLMMSATGVLLTYQRQITAWADTRGLGGAPPAPGAPRLSLDSLLARVRAAEPSAAPSAAPTAVTWRADPAAPAQVAFGRERTLFVNAYTGAVLGEGARGVRTFFQQVTAWHRWLAATGTRRDAGRAITGAANLGFLFLVVSGFYLWWPRRWTRAAVQNALLFRLGVTGRARDFNWHHVVGAWSLVPLFIVVLSGVVISYPWASALVYRVVGERPPAPAPRAAAPAAGERRAAPPTTLPPGLDGLHARAERRMPDWRTMTVQLPRADAKSVTVSLDRGTGGEPQHRAQLTLDAATGRELEWEPFAAASAGRRLRSVLRFAHTGEVLGIVGQTIAGLVSLGAVLLVWTGVSLSLRRLRAWLGRRRLAGTSTPDSSRVEPVERAA